jgi:hypothetical protein
MALMRQPLEKSKRKALEKELSKRRAEHQKFCERAASEGAGFVDALRLEESRLEASLSQL